MPKPELYNVNNDVVVAEPVLAKNPDGRLQLIEVNAGGELKVAVSGAGSGGTSMVDDAAFTPGTSGVTPAAGYYLVARDTLNDGDAGAVAITQKRALLVCLETPTGDSVMDDTNDAVRVNLVAGAGSGGTASSFGAAVPASGTAAGFSDGTNMQAARTFDADSGAGTENVLGVVLRKIASGGSVELGTLTDPIRVDPTGTTAQDVDVLSLPALAAGTNNIGDVDVLTLPALPAGTNNIGDVDVLTLPALPAGTNNIGDVDVLTVPADPFGANADAAATAGSTGSMQAKLRLMTSQLDAVKTAVELIDNTVGGTELQVDVVASLPAGTNNIGDVDVLTVPADPFGANADAAATAGSTGSIQAKLRLVTSQLDAIKTAVETIDNTVGGTELQVDVVGALPAGTNAIGKLAANTGVDIGDVDVTSVVPGTGATNLGKAEDAGHTTGDVGVMALAVRTDTLAASSGTTADYEAIKTNADGAMWVTNAPSTNGGLSTFHLVSAATTNATNVKASAGQLYGWYIYNSNAAARKIAFHNTAGTPTAGASVFFSVMIPPASAANALGTNGIAFSTGIGITTVTGIADSDSAAVAANDLIINLFYK